MIAKRRYKALMSRLMLAVPMGSGDRELLAGAARRYDVSDVEVVRARNDGKFIARGTHAAWGIVALEVIDPVANPTAACKALQADEFSAAHSAPIFPTIHAYELGCSVSQWILGETVARSDCAAMEAWYFIEFLGSIREWSCGYSCRKPLGEQEILSLLRRYIEISVRCLNYRSQWIRCGVPIFSV